MDIRWSKEMSSGNKKIDECHKELIKRVNSLLNSMSKGKGREEVSNLISFLENYIDILFEEEEDMMIKLDYPDYIAHRQEHLSFKSDFSDIQKEYMEKEVSSYFLIQIQKRMCKLLKEHHIITDKKLNEYIRLKEKE